MSQYAITNLTSLVNVLSLRNRHYQKGKCAPLNLNRSMMNRSYTGQRKLLPHWTALIRKTLQKY
ncbi:hypothetical protein KC19_2G030400 [Ceratodon purpureus]|uniref:Uncharacterized protein n=1 Tax=Ceratodon purpureus TaxID=3225 RepID=A0A8T0IPM4_CERPU|nr:hypothetical protein KC19_2G030400 [Ceratodon purpureus]